MTFEKHTFNFNYIPSAIEDNGKEARFLPLKNAQHVYAQETISAEMLNRAHLDPRFKQVMLEELSYTLKEFVDKVIEVNKQRLENK